MLYSIALFFHVLGAVGLFVALGVEWTSLRNLPRATTVGEARGWLGLFLLLRRIHPWSFVTILVTGIYMMAVFWGGAPWIALGLLAMLAIPALGAGMTARRVRSIGPALGEASELDASLRTRLSDPIMRLSLRLRIGLAVGIVFLMTVKPGWIGSLIAIAAFSGLGALASLPAWKRAEPTRPALPEEAGQ
jgi:hypothetical protein